MKRLAFLAFIVAACSTAEPATTTTETQPDPSPTTEAVEPVRLLALGDSYTVAEAIDPEGGWPAQLGDRMDLDTTIVGETGWTTGRMLVEFDGDNPAFDTTYDVVVVELGVNDAYNLVPTEVFGPSLSDILAKAVDLAGGDPDDVVVVSIADYTITPFGIDSGRVDSEDIGRFNATLRGIVSAAGTRFVDVTPLTLEAADDPTLLASDGLHYSASMYTRWVDLLEPEIRAATSGD